MLLSPPSLRTAFGSLNSVVRPAVRAGFANPWPFGGGIVVLQTTGRVSGLPRQVPVLATRCGNRLTVSTVRSDSHWLANIEAYPSVTVWIGGRPISGTAHVTRGSLNVVEIVLDPSHDVPGDPDDRVAAA